jgi:sarcosine oxidase subunit alpha
VLWRVPGREQDQFVDVQRDATVADVARAVGAGMRSVEHIKRYTTIGTAHDQGKTSGVIASGITAELLGVSIEKLGTTTFRPPYTPVPFAAAGRARPRCVVRSGAHHGAARLARRPRRGVRGRRAVERPRTTRPGEDMGDAVLRECAAVRTSASASSTARRSARSTCLAATPPSCWTASIPTR